MTLISPDNDLALMAVLFVIAGVAFLAEKTRVGSHLTGAVIAILSAIAVANLRIIPHSAPAFDFVFSYFVPVLIPLFLFKADLRHMLFETTRMTGAFLIASAGTVIGVIVAVSLLDLSNLAPGADIEPALREAGIAGLFTSTYIGGSVNYAALGEITGLSTDASFFSAAIQRRLPRRDRHVAGVELAGTAFQPSRPWRRAGGCGGHRADHGNEPDAGDGDGHQFRCNRRFHNVADRYSQPALRRHYDPCRDGGNGVPGADETSARRAMIQIAPLLIVLVLILLSVHLAVLLGVGRLFRLTLPELVTASNAAVLGATTAPALAAAKGWHDLVTPGVLVGVLGYALGTLIGTAVFHVFGLM
jgi:uncharacterized membrane protein